MTVLIIRGGDHLPADLGGAVVVVAGQMAWRRLELGFRRHAVCPGPKIRTYAHTLLSLSTYSGVSASLLNTNAMQVTPARWRSLVTLNMLAYVHGPEGMYAGLRLELGGKKGRGREGEEEGESRG